MMQDNPNVKKKMLICLDGMGVKWQDVTVNMRELLSVHLLLVVTGVKDVVKPR